MNAIRRVYIMAHLITHGQIMRRDLVYAFGMSGRNATNDLTAFQRLHGRLDRQEGRSQVYKLPADYDTTVPMKHVDHPVRLISRVFGDPVEVV